MKKRLLSGLLVLVMLLTMLPMTVLAEEAAEPAAPAAEITGGILVAGEVESGICFELLNVPAGAEVYVELYSGETELTDKGITAVDGGTMTCTFYTVGKSSSWTQTDWTAYDAVVPTHAVLYIDAVEVGTCNVNFTVEEWVAFPGTEEAHECADEAGDGYCDDESCGLCLHTKGEDGYCTTADCAHESCETCGGKAPEEEPEHVCADSGNGYCECGLCLHTKGEDGYCATADCAHENCDTCGGKAPVEEPEVPDPVYYVIEAEDGKHGDVSPEGVVFVEAGDSQTFWFTPDYGYEVSAVYVDGYLVHYYGLCYDHYWNCRGCDDCWWVDWSEWYGCHEPWCDHDDCWYDYDDGGCYWYDWQDSITFHDVDEDHTLYVEFSPIGAGCPSAYYWDLNTDAWYHEATDFVIENGLMEGVGGKYFDPNGATTRGQLVTMLYRLAGEPRVSGSSEFLDVADGKWYSDAVIWAARKGIVEGYGNGYFGVNDVVTREQTVAILYRYAKYMGCSVSDLDSLKAFLDADEVSEFARKPFGWAVEEDIIEGKPVSGWNLKLDPMGSTARVEMAAMLMRYAEYVD